MNKNKKIEKLEKEFDSIKVKRIGLYAKISKLQEEYDSTNNRYYYLKGMLQEYKEELEKVEEHRNHDKQNEDVSG